MRIYHFNYMLEGGAAIAARRLHDQLVQRRVNSQFLFYYGDRPSPDYVPEVLWRNNPFWKLTSLYRRKLRGLSNRLRGRQKTKAFFTNVEQPFRTPVLKEWLGDSVLHLHWVPFLLDLPSFFNSVPPHQPVVWTMHDMNPGTGGCHYSGNCDRYTSGCGSCPILESSNPQDASCRNWRLKREAISRLKNLHVATDSTWLEGCAQNSPLFENAASIQTIHYGLDSVAFAPSDKAAARASFGLKDGEYVVAFGAFSLNDARKGGGDLIEAVNLLPVGERPTLLVFGNDPDSFKTSGTRVISTGLLSDARSLANLYSASDLFCLPSLQEAFGQTAMESLACGTPVVAYDGTGAVDIVKHNYTGRLVKQGDVQALAREIRWMMTHQTEATVFGANGRQLVIDQFTLDHQANKYLDLYQNAINN